LPTAAPPTDRSAPATEASAPNAEMIRYWNEQAGPTWVSVQERLDTQIGPLGAESLARAALQQAERVLDVGCGCGATTLAIAEAVGATGRVLAVDISAPMLERARARAAERGLGERIAWQLADAQTASFEPQGADCVFSRFGVMFFDDPVAAFTNLRAALRPGGRLAFVCWQARERNPWMMVPALAAMRHVAFPPPPPADAPGPFAFADAERVRGILDDAGFSEVACSGVETALRVGGGSLDDAVELMVSVGPVGAALREARATDAQRARVIDAVREALESFDTPRGLEAPAAAWIVTARRP
jgi:SAM-dependent methyltransferase